MNSCQETRGTALIPALVVQGLWGALRADLLQSSQRCKMILNPRTRLGVQGDPVEVWERGAHRENPPGSSSSIHSDVLRREAMLGTASSINSDMRRGESIPGSAGSINSDAMRRMDSELRPPSSGGNIMPGSSSSIYSASTHRELLPRDSDLRQPGSRENMLPGSNSSIHSASARRELPPRSDNSIVSTSLPHLGGTGDIVRTGSSLSSTYGSQTNLHSPARLGINHCPTCLQEFQEPAPHGGLCPYCQRYVLAGRAPAAIEASSLPQSPPSQSEDMSNYYARTSSSPDAWQRPQQQIVDRQNSMNSARSNNSMDSARFQWDSARIDRYIMPHREYAHCEQDIHLLARLLELSRVTEADSETVILLLRALKFLRLCDYSVEDICSTLAHASAYFVDAFQLCGTQMDACEVGNVLTTLMFVAHCYVQDETCPLHVWHQHLFKTYCPLRTLNVAIVRLMEIRRYVLRLDNEDFDRRYFSLLQAAQRRVAAVEAEVVNPRRDVVDVDLSGQASRQVRPQTTLEEGAAAGGGTDAMLSRFLDNFRFT